MNLTIFEYKCDGLMINHTSVQENGFYFIASFSVGYALTTNEVTYRLCTHTISYIS